jgi:type IV pilus assembly protein PilN
MRITLNLASRPHIDLRPYVQRLRLWMALLAMLAVCLWLVLRNEENKAAIARAEQDQLQQGTNRLRKEQQGFQAAMRQPQNAAVLQQSEFLNQLFEQKSFSWTAAMMDLEDVLPAGVQVSSIEPGITREGTVSIRLRVMGPRDKAVDLIRNLEHSKRFVGPRLTGETTENNNSSNGPVAVQPISASNQVTFEILSEYNPLSATKEEKHDKGEKHETTKPKTAEKPPVQKLPSTKKLPSKSPAINPAPSKGPRQGGSQ